MTRQVIVPQDQLNQLEAARQRLYEWMDYYINDKDKVAALVGLLSITRVMYELGNRNYPEHKELFND